MVLVTPAMQSTVVIVMAVTSRDAHVVVSFASGAWAQRRGYPGAGVLLVVFVVVVLVKVPVLLAPISQLLDSLLLPPLIPVLLVVRVRQLGR